MALTSTLASVKGLVSEQLQFQAQRAMSTHGKLHQNLNPSKGSVHSPVLTEPQPRARAQELQAVA